MASAPAAAQHAPSIPHDRQIISAETIRNAGITRLSEIVLLVDAWDVTSIDGFTFAASARGSSSFQRQSWFVMIDGQEVDLNLFGARSLNRVPIALGQIDSIEIVSTPRIREGQFIDSGLIHIHTHRPARGLSVRGFGATANETGDPGPYLFTELRTPNIDRIGSGGSGVVSYGWRGGYVDASLAKREHVVTNLLVRERNVAILADEFPVIRQEAYSLKASVEAGGGVHELYAGHSSTRDYFFLKPYGREVPAESPFTQLGINGSLGFAPATELRYRAIYAANELSEHANTLDLDFDWRLKNWTVELEAGRRGESYRATLGAGLERTSAETDYPLSDDGYTLWKLYGEVRNRLHTHLRQRLALSLTGSAGDMAVKGAISERFGFARRHTLEVVLSYSERLPEEDGRVWFWLRRGYGFLPDNGVEVTMDGDLGKSRTIAGDLFWTGRPHSSLSLRFGGYVRSFSGLTLEDQTFELNPDDGSFFGSPVRVLPQREGEIAGLEIAADYTPVRQLDLRFIYRHQTEIGGDSVFADAWKTIPEHRVRMSAQFIPWSDVSLWAMVDYRTSAFWADYRLADGQSGGVYSAEVGDVVAVNLAVQKWLWHRRLRVNLQLRNLFSEPEPYHPIGAAYDLSFIVLAELLLDGILRPR